MRCGKATVLTCVKSRVQNLNDHHVYFILSGTLEASVLPELFPQPDIIPNIIIYTATIVKPLFFINISEVQLFFPEDGDGDDHGSEDIDHK